MKRRSTDGDGEGAQLAWKVFFQRREPVAKPTKPVKKAGRPPKQAPPIEEVRTPCLNDTESAVNKSKRSEEEVNKTASFLKKSPGEATAASKLFNVPRTTVLSRMKKEREGAKETKRGRKPLLNDYYEKLLADFARSMDSLNMPLGADQIKDKAMETLKHVGKYDEKKKLQCANRWKDGFMKRHNLTQHKPQDYEHCRQANTNPHLLGKLFSAHKGAIEFCKKESHEPLTADDVFNVDECGIERDPGAISTSASTLFMLYETNAL